ncbi:hypothetical protein V501_03457, partial [Pseudogymnoascus sp. VKM F-4519 (FW-2642)]
TPYTIESHLASKDPFRVSPQLHIPPPLPHDSQPCSETARTIEASLHTSIISAASSFGITDASISALKVWERGLPDTARDTLIISTSSTDTTRWRKAVDRIYEMVEAAAVPAGVEMGVELRNPQEMYDDISRPIRDHDVCRALDAVEPVVLAEVKMSCGRKWTSIAYHCRKRRGPEYWDGPGRNSILVYVNPGSRARWGEVEERISRAVEGVVWEGGDVVVELEILMGFNIPGFGQDIMNQRFEQWIKRVIDGKYETVMDTYNDIKKSHLSPAKGTETAQGSGMPTWKASFSIYQSCSSALSFAEELQPQINETGDATVRMAGAEEATDMPISGLMDDNQALRDENIKLKEEVERLKAKVAALASNKDSKAPGRECSARRAVPGLLLSCRCSDNDKKATVTTTNQQQ